MGVLQFNGSSNYLKWASLATALRTVPAGAWTFLAGVRHNSLVSPSWQGYEFLLSGTGNGTTQAGIGKSDLNHLHSDVGSPSTDRFWPGLDPAIDEDTLFVASKPTGTAYANASKKVGASGAWSHAASNVQMGNKSNAVQLQLGTWQLSTVDALNGWMALVAIWNVELSEAQREACGANWRTSDIYNAHPTPPLVLLEMNVVKTSLVNLGTASLATFTSNGTSVDATKTFDGWDFNGISAPGVDETSFIPLL